MLIPRSHAWTAVQKLLLAFSVVLGLTILVAFVYIYERDQRGLREDALVGTWVHQPANSESLYYDFRRDGTLVVMDSGGQPIDTTGKWYAGGPNIYIRFPLEVLRDRQLVVWHIVDISPGQFRVRAWRDDEPMIYQRMKPPKAALESRN